jgi:hypothetical protein
MVDDKIYLETMMQLDGSNLIVRHTGGAVSVSSGNGDFDMEDATPCQCDFRADEVSEDEPAVAPSEAADEHWATPTALKMGHSYRDAFQNDMDGDSSSESEQAERGIGGRASNMTTRMVF